ncbi:MAG TPA: TOBE domain-containing protein [Geobacteraceae bacterium]|jgi:molybdate transport system regulatory protein|nr:TOBE domain-containing protein [Geobacteraceae bacterium]
MRRSRKQIEVTGTVSLKKTDMEFLGSNRIALLEKIDECGSISKAAKAVGISYKTAWDAINAISALSEKPLFVRVTGGRSGGGTSLTEEGREVIRTYRIIQEQHEKFLTNLEDKMGDVDATGLNKFVNKISKQASARNIFAGTVEKIVKGEVKSEVTLALKGGDHIVAMITNESVDSLGLVQGSDAYAIVKSGSVIIGTGPAEIRVSIRNKLCGKIAHLTQGAVNTEVNVELPGRTSISAVITNACARTLELKEGEPVCAMFKASSVILGVG